jgi:hypothetical protein
MLTGPRHRLLQLRSIATSWRARDASDLPDLARVLADPRAYELEVDRLLDRHAFGRGLYELREGPVSLASVATRRSEVARRIAETVARGEYQPGAAELRTIRVRGKRRSVVALGLVDRLVHGVVADALERAIEPTLSPRLLSYRPGIPWWRGVQEMAAWIRRQRAASAVGQRGPAVYVIRRDVRAYTDTIPVDDGSRLWPMIDTALLGRRPSPPWAQAVLRSVVRPAVAVRGGTASPRDRGVPTGQPISCVLFNLYLRDLDRRLADLVGGFYARYSDDVVFAHPDPAMVQHAADIIAAGVAELGLALNEAKSRDAYLTVAGHASRDWPTARGAQFVPLLGLRVGADGTVGLEPAKARELVRDLRRRAWAAAAAGTGPEESAALACLVIRRSLQVDDPEVAVRAAGLLRHVVTDRRQLAELDHRIAREVAGLLVGNRTVRAFRSMPAAVLRDRFGLPSLVAMRNRARAAANRT